MTSNFPARLKSFLFLVMPLAMMTFGASGLFKEWQGLRAMKLSPQHYFSFEPAELMLGVGLRQNTEYESEVKVRNVSDVPVNLVRFGSNCTCTVASAKIGVIQPGESRTATVKFRTAMREFRFDQPCIVFYSVNDESVQRHEQFSVTGEIEPEYTVSDEEIHFESGTSSTCRVSIRRIAAKTLQIRPTGSTCSAVTTNVAADPVDEMNCHLEFAFDSAKYKGGIGKDRVFLATGSDLVPSLEIGVSVHQ